jgi:hypothetical protein
MLMRQTGIPWVRSRHISSRCPPRPGLAVIANLSQATFPPPTLIHCPVGLEMKTTNVQVRTACRALRP